MPLDVDLEPWTLRLDTTRVTSGSDVTSWTDLSGNGKNMTGSGPTIGGTTPTGMASISFDGSNDKFTSSHAMTNFITDTEFTMYAVVEVASFSSVGYFYGEACIIRDNGGYVGLYTGPGDGIGGWVGDTWPWPNPEETATAYDWYVVAYRLKSDGTLGVSLDGGASWDTDAAGDAIGSLAGSLEFGYGAGPAYFMGEMAAIYMIDSAHSDSDVGDVYAYLHDRFILAASSPGYLTDVNVTDVATVPSATVIAGADIASTNVTSTATVPSPSLTTSSDQTCPSLVLRAKRAGMPVLVGVRAGLRPLVGKR